MKDIDRWWLAGMPISETSAWFPYRIAATGGADITNQVLVYGLAAGVSVVAIFGVIVTLAFRRIGVTLQSLKANYASSDEQTRIIWGLGVAVSVHLSNWFGISYFDQSYAVWLLHLSVISGVHGYFLAREDRDPHTTDWVRMEAEDPGVDPPFGLSHPNRSVPDRE
jgi:hypothetical protein